jgi:hypothetical protein
MAAIAVLSQNERTLRYIIDLSTEHNVWKSIFKLLLSIKEHEAKICGRMLEALTRHDTNRVSSISYWSIMLEHDLLPTLLHVFSFTKQDDVLISAFVLFYNLVTELPNIKCQLNTLKNPFSAMLKHMNSSNEQILVLLGRLFSLLSEEKQLIDTMVEQGLMDVVINFLNEKRSPTVCSPFFDCLSNVIAYADVYQQTMGNAKDFLLLIVNVYLEEFDVNLSLAVMRFIRPLVKHNQQIQTLMSHYGACEHLLGALAAISKELQYVTVEAIQAMADRNVYVQEIFLRERAMEQLLSLLEKTNLSHLQMALVCTLWTLCEHSQTRRHEVATRIGVRKLISFFTMKTDDDLLLAVTEALNELARCPASIQMNIQDEIHQSQGIPYLMRLLKSDHQSLVLSVLQTLQCASCAPGFVANRINQDMICKNDGLVSIVALMMHAKNELVQVEASQTLACIALSMFVVVFIRVEILLLSTNDLDHSTCSTMIETTLDFSYEHLIDLLMKSSNVDVRLKASNALATFVYNNSRVQLYLSQHHRLSFDYFEKLLDMHDDDVRRCFIAFQVRVLVWLFNHWILIDAR